MKNILNLKSFHCISTGTNYYDEPFIFIIDNGKGFDMSQSGNGLGLTLTKNRIALLNSIYKGSSITLEIKSEPLSTTVTVTLSQWL